MTDNFFDNILKDVDKSMDDRAENTEFIDTGSYSFNALISADIYGGYARDRILGLAGETQTGKTFLAMGMLDNFFRKFPDGRAVEWDTEGAITKETFNKRGIDASKIAIRRPKTVEALRNDLAIVMDNYKKLPEKQRSPLAFILDSLGNLASEKEVADALSGSDKGDMTRAKMIKSLFRIATLDLQTLKVPFIVTNHVYDNVGGYGDKKVSGGGSGFQFLPSTVVFLSKAKHKDGEEVVGVKLTAESKKSRFSKPFQKIEMLLDFNKGLNRYYGLLDIAEQYDIIKKVSTRYEMPDGSKHFEKAIYNEPERFFTADILERINQHVKQDFGLGENNVTIQQDIEIETTEAERI